MQSWILNEDEYTEAKGSPVGLARNRPATLSGSAGRCCWEAAADPDAACSSSPDKHPRVLLMWGERADAYSNTQLIKLWFWLVNYFLRINRGSGLQLSFPEYSRFFSAAVEVSQYSSCFDLQNWILISLKPLC